LRAQLGIEKGTFLNVPEPATRHERLQNLVLLPGICAFSVDKSSGDMTISAGINTLGRPVAVFLSPRLMTARSKCSRMVAFRLAGADVVADHQGALWWPAERVLVLADLHFEKGSSFAARTSQMLPPYDTHATLRVVEEVVARRAPDCIICLGDNFHDREGPSRLDADARRRLDALMAGRRFVWIEGNHDAAAAAVLGGESFPELVAGPLVFRHEPRTDGDVAGEVAGHLHPAVRVAARGRHLRRKCFVTDGVRCVLPSIGAFTGGLDVDDRAFGALFERAYCAYALGQGRVYPFPTPAFVAAGGYSGLAVAPHSNS
jgi:DNA ligase-associated metallophosphoesterase